MSLPLLMHSSKILLEDGFLQQGMYVRCVCVYADLSSSSIDSCRIWCVDVEECVLLPNLQSLQPPAHVTEWVHSIDHTFWWASVLKQLGKQVYTYDLYPSYRIK